jgi:hypothetical protein
VLKISTEPELIMKSVTGAPPTVKVDVPGPAAVKVRSAVPPMLSELREMVGTFVIVPATVRLIITSSAATGIAPSSQLPGTVHEPPPGRFHVFIAPNVKVKEERMHSKIKMEKDFPILSAIAGRFNIGFFEVIYDGLIIKLRFQYNIKKLRPALISFF